MQALAERLDALLHQANGASGGRTEFAGADPLQFAALKTVTPTVDACVGRPVTRVARRGKFLLVDLDGPRVLIHLSQGGRVVVEDPPKRSRPKRGVVRLRFTRAPALLIVEYGTERKAGWWLLTEGDEGPLERLGPEPHDDAFATFLRTSRDSRRLHTILRDQRTVAGIGRGYSDDILHRAGLSPFAALASLDGAERKRLLDAVAAVLAEGLAVERRRQGGLPPKLGDHWIVHGRSGEPCPSCDHPLARVSYETHDVTYCPACQTDGRVLKDRRLSRLLK